MAAITLYRTAERPGLQFWVTDDTGALIDFSSGYTFEFKVGRPGAAAVLTKTTGITGAAGSGTEASGTPNLTIQFTAGETDVLTRKRHTGQIRATTGGVDRVFEFPVNVLDVVT